MFRRRNPLEGDVVAAAQRRLAALAAQHPPAGQAAQSPRLRPEVAAGDHSAEIGQDTRQGPVAPRHLASRRTEVGRWGISATQVTVAALLVVGLVVAVAWWTLRSVPAPEPVTLGSHRYEPSITTPGLPSSATMSSPAPVSGVAVGSTGPVSGSARLVVDVAGKVRHPGIVELPAGSRVVDAIAAAGGSMPGVSLTSLNLARLLVDGEQIVVGVDIPVTGGAGMVVAGGEGAAGGTLTQVNLNTATAEQLDSLPGVGPVTAQAILRWRADNGAFASVDELLEVSGIGPATLADVRPYVVV